MASWHCWRTVCGCTCHRIGQHLPSPILFFGCSVGGRAIVALHFGARVYIHRERRRNKEFLRLTVVLTVAMGLECEVAPLRSGFIRILWVDWWDAAKKIPRDAFFLSAICVCENKSWNKRIENPRRGGWPLSSRGEHFSGLFLTVILTWSFFLSQW